MTNHSRKVKVSIQELLRFGAFGPLTIGASRLEVRSILGDPDDSSVSSRRERLPAIWKYGVIEFHFDLSTDRVWLIHADGFNRLQAGEAVDFDPWWMSSDTTLEQALEALSVDGMPIEPMDWPWDDSMICFRAGVGVKLYFEREPPHRFLAFSWS
jgi:hypothetical protein